MPNILVVEDDENLNRGITFSLKKSGYEVFSAESVKKAKRIASDNNVDVTICDVNLPDGNGLELVRWMRNCQNVYIICLLSLQIQTFPKRHLIYHSILLLLHHDKNSVCHEYEEKNLSIPTKTVKYPMYTARQDIKNFS